MKTWVKGTIIWIWSAAVLVWAWAWATKLGYIPNWLEIEALCPGTEEIVIDDIDMDDNWDESSRSWTWWDVPVSIVDEIKHTPNGEDDHSWEGRFDEQDRKPIDIVREIESDPEIMRSQEVLAYKPIIYLYPEEKTLVKVKLWSPEKLLHSYPKYSNGGWSVIAKPDGSLIDTESGRSLYALYWEGINNLPKEIKEWFVVKGENTAAFLEEKLALLWLNGREAEEFIVYWLPVLEVNEWNLIRFRTMDEINKDMPLEISPKPDSIIRVLMQFEALDSYKEVPEQVLVTPKREWFVVVEWWGEKENTIK